MTAPAVLALLRLVLADPHAGGGGVGGGMGAVRPTGPAAGRAAAGVGAGVADCFPSQPVEGPGVVDPFHIPAAAAAQLNADGKVLYRQGRWDAAREKYRAAEAADPEFLAPLLNVACSYVRQERFSEAVAEAVRLLDRAYLPWREELSSAADMGALKVRPEGKLLQAAVDRGRQRWASGVARDLIFIARTRPPLKVGDPMTTGGTFVLAPRQEVFAWSPRTRRYRQLTSEEGRVLALARSPDGRRVAYLTAEKLAPMAGGLGVGLRGITAHEMDLETLTSLAHAAVEGDALRVEVGWTAGHFVYRVKQAGGPTAFKLEGDRLQPITVPPTARFAVALTGRGVARAGTPLPTPTRLPPECPGTARDGFAKSGTPAVVVTAGDTPGAARSSPTAVLGASFGSGLSGLPLP